MGIFITFYIILERGREFALVHVSKLIKVLHIKVRLWFFKAVASVEEAGQIISGIKFIPINRLN